MNEQGLYDIYGMWHIPFWQKPVFFWSTVLFGVLFLLVISFYIMRKFLLKKRPLKPGAIALVALEGLKKRNIQNAKEGQALYFDLTTILKAYIHDSLGYDVIGLTDAELIEFLDKNYFPAQSFIDLKSISNGCLYIKFAQELVIKDQIEQDLQKSMNIIHKVEQHLQLRDA